MKKMIIALTAMLTFTVAANAMSYEQARNQALFLTDKMAYELNLTDEQYEAAYEVNLDYLMNVSDVDDLYGDYWRYRNMDLSYILYDWQYNLYSAASYFYRPLYWDSGYWHFGIYSYYPHRNFYYFDRPDVYVSYRGGHSWGMNGGRSYFRGRSFNHSEYGMRNGWDNGRYGNGYIEGRGGMRTSNHSFNARSNSFGNNSGVYGNGDRSGRISSTRSSENGSFGNGGGRYSNSRSNGFGSSSRSNEFSGGNSRSNGFGNSGTYDNSSRSGSRFSNGSFGGGSRSFGSSSSSTSRSFGNSSAPSGRSFSAPSRSFSGSSQGGGFSGGSRSSGFGGGSSSSSSSTRSFGGGGSSFGGGSSHSNGGGGGSFGGGGMSSGGGHFGGHR